jgi:two-component system sensor histidine kinase BarA
MLKVHIVDTGKGIREQDINRLFSMFGKLLRTAEMNHEGIGMGLMICQKLVHENCGMISAHSLGEDRGSNFSFSMKMRSAPFGQIYPSI